MGLNHYVSFVMMRGSVVVVKIVFIRLIVMIKLRLMVKSLSGEQRNNGNYKPKAKIMDMFESEIFLSI